MLNEVFQSSTVVDGQEVSVVIINKKEANVLLKLLVIIVINNSSIVTVIALITVTNIVNFKIANKPTQRVSHLYGSPKRRRNQEICLI